MNRKSDIELLDLNPKFTIALLKAKLFTYKSILTLSVPELQKKTKLSDQEVNNILSIVARAILNHNTFFTAYQLKSSNCSDSFKSKKLSFGCPILNSLLRGGLLLGHIVEIAGESAGGKTQLCLQLALHSQLSPDLNGINGEVAYICTEDVFPIKRLHQMTKFLYKLKPNSFNNINFMDNIHITQIGDLPNLWKCINKTLPTLLQYKNVKLVVIDSIAALFRCEFDINQTIERSRNLQSLGFTLHRLASKYQVVIICVNQITDVITDKIKNQKSVPSLGLTWSNLIHARLMVSRTNRTIEQKVINSNTSLFLTVRKLEIIFAPHLPQSACPFIITTEGVKGLTESFLNTHFQNFKL